GYSPIRLFSHFRYSLLEALSVQNHHRTFGTERSIIIPCHEWLGFPSTPRHCYVMPIFIHQHRMAQRTLLFIYQFVRPEHPSRNGYINLFHTVINRSFCLQLANKSALSVSAELKLWRARDSIQSRIILKTDP